MYKGMKKILIVGYGSIGKRHVKNLLKESDYEILICTKQKNLKFRNKRIRTYNSLKQCLDEKPTIGFVTNETSLHVQTAIKLAKNNLDLFLEKPLSNSEKNVNKLKKIVKEKKLIVQMGYHFRFHKCIKKIYQLILQKKIGKIISVQIENNSYLPDWHPYEDYTKSYASKEKLGGGIVLTQIHELDYLYWFFGKPKSIFSVTGKFSDLKLSVDDFSSSIIEFKHKIIAEVHLDFFQGPDFKSCKIKGTNGIIYWDSDLNQVKYFNNKKRRWEIILKLKNFQRNQMYIDEIRNFLRSIKERKKTNNNLDDGIISMNMALAIKKSAKNKKIIRMK